MGKEPEAQSTAYDLNDDFSLSIKIIFYLCALACVFVCIWTFDVSVPMTIPRAYICKTCVCAYVRAHMLC